jgi:hypothetical protein
MSDIGKRLIIVTIQLFFEDKPHPEPHVAYKRQVMNVINKSKLCQTGRVLEHKTGERVTCPNHDGRCTANLASSAPISDEKQYAKESIQELSRAGINVKHVTTDPDSASYRAAEELYAAGSVREEPIHQLDTRHQRVLQKKFINNTKFSVGMFSGRTLRDREKMQRRLADDMPNRCQAEHAAALEYLVGDHGKVKIALSYTVDAMMMCYQGDHTHCRKASFVCDSGKTNNWVCRSAYLPNQFKVTCTDDDLIALRKCINNRLGPNMLDKTKLLLNTQKCESVNRAIVSTVPKSVTFSRNHDGRTHSAVGSVNRGIGQVTIDQCEAVGAPIVRGSRVAKGLQRRQTRDDSRKKAKKSQDSKAKRFRKRKFVFEHYDSEAANKCYKKGVAMTALQSNKPRRLPEHAYSRSKVVPSTSQVSEKLLFSVCAYFCVSDTLTLFFLTFKTGK